MSTWIMRPVEAVVDRLPFSRKVVVLGTCLLLPLGVTLHAQLGAQQTGIAVAVAEQEGLAVVGPGVLLLADASAARGAGAAGQAAATDTVRADLADLLAARARLSDVPRSDDELAAVERAVATAVQTADVDRGPAWVAVQDATTAYVDAETSRSQLILDPALASYFVMDALTARIPALLVAASTGQAQAGTLDGTSPVSAHTDLAVTAAGVDAAAAALVADVGTADADTPALTASLQAPVAAVLTAGTDQVQALRAVAVGEPGAPAAVDPAALGATAVIGTARTAAAALTRSLDDLLQERGDGLRTQRAVALAVTGTALALAVWVALGFLLSTRRRLRSINDVLTAVAATDFTHRADVGGSDELTAMAARLDEAAVQVGDVFTQLSARSDQARVAADRLGVLATGMEGRVADDADRALTQATDARAAAADVDVAAGGGVEMVSAITEITVSASRASTAAGRARDRVEQTGRAVRELADSAERVREVVALITTVADQTNLLALNATIEAARAGDLGRGFAVVAAEVKDLARITAGATGDIERLVSESTARAARAQQLVDELIVDIGDVDEAQSVIAAAVEEQSATGAQMRSVLTTGSEAVARLGVAAGTADEAARRAVGDARAVTSAARQMTETVEALDAIARRVRT